MYEKLRTIRGVMRSLRLYYGDRRRETAIDYLFCRFVKPGDMVFDIGAHVGDRTAAFRRLHARVIAVEPQPVLAWTLKMMYRGDVSVIIERAAVGRSVGATDLMINVDNPTVSTASEAFIRNARDAPGWEGQAWTRTIRVPMTTIDALIAKYGVPSFIKIDVEGYEKEVLAGLTQLVDALSFEFTTIQRKVAFDCVERCCELGLTRFNAALGESHVLMHNDWLGKEAIMRWLAELPHTANSGDIYAVPA